MQDKPRRILSGRLCRRGTSAPYRWSTPRTLHAAGSSSPCGPSSSPLSGRFSSCAVSLGSYTSAGDRGGCLPTTAWTPVRTPRAPRSYASLLRTSRRFVPLSSPACPVPPNLQSLHKPMCCLVIPLSFPLRSRSPPPLHLEFSIVPADFRTPSTLPPSTCSCASGLSPGSHGGRRAGRHRRLHRRAAVRDCRVQRPTGIAGRGQPQRRLRDADGRVQEEGACGHRRWPVMGALPGIYYNVCSNSVDRSRSGKALVEEGIMAMSPSVEQLCCLPRDPWRELAAVMRALCLADGSRREVGEGAVRQCRSLRLPSACKTCTDF